VKRFMLYLAAAVIGLIASAIVIAIASVFGYSIAPATWWIAGFACAWWNRVIVDAYDTWRRGVQP